ncbi:hypothetical protein SPHINGO391_70012 [Sphingomonas aurantiaca]|uniref:Uncharacterized protein n=1 Tax=Sphingomonas aurantiaca TaxID=185949 RepID=A0A5E8AMI4_9SPHN|nr:hypothetical protein SPHINGO391_70012 [Sphingomonas aurantiaca]
MVREVTIRDKPNFIRWGGHVVIASTKIFVKSDNINIKLFFNLV